MITLQIHDMLLRTFYYAALGISQIKKVCFQVLSRGIYSKNTFLNESASKIGHWWLIFNHYKLAHFFFLSDHYGMKLLL